MPTVEHGLNATEEARFRALHAALLNACGAINRVAEAGESFDTSTRRADGRWTIGAVCGVVAREHVMKSSEHLFEAVEAVMKLAEELELEDMAIVITKRSPKRGRKRRPR